MILLLTGATSGIGFELLKNLVEEGNKVYAVGRNFDSINLFFGNTNDSIIQIKIDLSLISEIKNIFTIIEQNSEKLDGFINCAGFEETLPIKVSEYNNIKYIFDVNVFSTIEILKYFALKKYSNDESSIVLISSVMGFLGQSGKLGYCSSKAAINGIVKASALELSNRKFRVNSISPGIVKSKMSENLFLQVGEKKSEEIKNMHPLGIGETTDIVPSVLFLLSPGSKWITGIDLVIDGGYSIQ